MKTKLLLSFEDGKLVGAVANNDLELYAENMDELSGIHHIQTNSIPDSDFQALIDGRING